MRLRENQRLVYNERERERMNVYVYAVSENYLNWPTIERSHSMIKGRSQSLFVVDTNYKLASESPTVFK